MKNTFIETLSLQWPHIAQVQMSAAGDNRLAGMSLFFILPSHLWKSQFTIHFISLGASEMGRLTKDCLDAGAGTYSTHI